MKAIRDAAAHAATTVAFAALLLLLWPLLWAWNSFDDFLYWLDSREA